MAREQASATDTSRSSMRCAQSRASNARITCSPTPVTLHATAGLHPAVAPPEEPARGVTRLKYPRKEMTQALKHAARLLAMNGSDFANACLEHSQGIVLEC